MSRLERELKEKLQADREAKDEIPFTDRLFVFFSTLILLYILFFGIRYILMFVFGIAAGFSGIDFGWLNPIIHAAIWAASFYSAYRNRSVLDDVMKII